MVQKLVRTKRVLERQGAIVDMYTDYIQMPNGREAKWDFIAHRKGAAAVVAVLPDDLLITLLPYSL